MPMHRTVSDASLSLCTTLHFKPARVVLRQHTPLNSARAALGSTLDLAAGQVTLVSDTDGGHMHVGVTSRQKAEPYRS